MLHKLVWLALFGACGTLARYGLAGIVQRSAGSAFPVGTFTVNITGCFLFGLIWTLSQDRLAISSEVRTIALTGFMGAFTTFSTFMFETDQMLEQSQWFMAGLNVVLQLAIGLLAYVLGCALGRIF